MKYKMLIKCILFFVIYVFNWFFIIDVVGIGLNYYVGFISLGLMIYFEF